MNLGEVLVLATVLGNKMKKRHVLAILYFNKKQIILIIFCLISLNLFSINYSFIALSNAKHNIEYQRYNNLLSERKANAFFQNSDTLPKVNYQINSFFVEFLGSAAVWSFNYERTLFGNNKNNLSFRIGVGTIIEYTVIPALINYELNLNKTISFETGIGSLIRGNDVIGLIGFRFLISKHFLIRTSFTPSIYRFSTSAVEFGRSKYFNPWGGISLGYSFGK